MNRFLVPVALSVMLLLGCRLHDVVPDPPPPIELPESFNQAGGDASAPDRWWESFGDSALSDTIEGALAGNLNLRAAWSRLE